MHVYDHYSTTTTYDDMKSSSLLLVQQQQQQHSSQSHTLPHGCPPIDPGGPADAVSYTALDMALRTHPDLSREGSATLNPTALAKLVEGLRRFIRENLGKDAKGSRRGPMVCIPDSIWRDRSRTGALYVALVAVFRHRQAAKWRNFDFDVAKRHDEHIAMLKRVEKDLIAAGHIVRPRIYLDDTVPREHVAQLEGIVTRFDGMIVDSPLQATHIVAFDEEVDTPETFDENKEPERMYLRTLSVFQPKQPAGYPQMALVHWWFWPSSCDEWMPAANVDGDVEEIPEKPTGAWCVSCRFVRDVARFNEWGSENDYAILDYQKKVACFSKKHSGFLTKDKAPIHDEQLKKDYVFGMNSLTPKYITAGTRSQKQIVYDGSLNIMSDVKMSMNDLVKKSGFSQDELSTSMIEDNNARLIRPTEDLQIGDSIAATELKLSLDVCKNENGEVDSISMKTVCSNTVIPNTCLARDPGTQRIRGGGQADETSQGSIQPCQGATKIESSDATDTAKSKEQENKPVVKSEPDVVSSSNGEKDSEKKSLLVTGSCAKSYPSWFDQQSISGVEKKALPEWFDGSVVHRNEASYIKARQEILKKAAQSPEFFLTATVVRKSIAGDVGSLVRLHSFLVTWGFINSHAIGDSTPTMYRQEDNFSKEILQDTWAFTEKVTWDNEHRSALSKSIVNQVMKKRKHNTTEDDIDWDQVSNDVGQPAEACCKEFIEAPLIGGNDYDSQTESSQLKQRSTRHDNSIHELMQGVHPEVIKAAFQGAMRASNDVDEARKAAALAIMATTSTKKAKVEDESIEGLMSEILNYKMIKLESKMNDLDDVEGMLDAERVALELERRDLYAMRCRYWLGE